MKNLLITFIFAVALTTSYSQTAQEGLRYLEVEKFVKAKKVFSQLYKNDPSAENAFYLGNYYYTIEKPDSARIYFQEGLNKDPKNPWNYLGMGEVLYSSNQTEAKTDLEKALKLADSKNTALKIAVAKAFIDADKLEVPEAFKTLEIAAKHAPKDPEISVVRGDAYLKIGDPTKAVGQYEEALKLDSKYPKALMRLGDIYQRVQNYNLALDYYNKVIANDSLYAPAYREMGDASYKKKDYDKAFAYYKKYISMADEDENTAVKYGYFLVLAKNYKKAISVLQPYEKQEKVNPIIYRLLAYSEYETGDYDKGIEDMKKYWEVQNSKKYAPSDFEYYGKLLLKKDQDSLAVVNFEKALQMDSSRVDIYGDLGTAYLGMQKYDKAAAAYEKKIAKKTSTLDLYNMGRAYFYDKQFEKADTTFGKLLSYVPNYPQGYLWKAKSKTFLDPTSENGLAKPYFEKFIELTKGDVDKNKKDLITAYDYLGYYYLLKSDRAKAKEAYLKMKELDPGNKKAEDGLKIANGAK